MNVGHVYYVDNIPDNYRINRITFYHYPYVLIATNDI